MPLLPNMGVLHDDDNLFALKNDIIPIKSPKLEDLQWVH